MFVAKLTESGVEPFHAFAALVIPRRIVGSRQARESITGQFAFLDGVHAASSEASPFIDEKVVHDPTQPRSGFFDFHEVVELAVYLDEELLKKIFRFGLLSGQAPSETVQPVEVRSYEFFKRAG